MDSENGSEQAIIHDLSVPFILLTKASRLIIENKQHMKVLIVEDEQELLNSMLVYLGISVWNAGRPKISRTRFVRSRAHPFDRIVLDIGPPDGSGLRVIEEMSEKGTPDQYPNRFRTEFTGRPADRPQHRADDYITKPFHMPELGARIKSVFRRRFPQGVGISLP